MDKITIGIGLYVWNGEKTIDQTLNSLIKQTYQINKDIFHHLDSI
jgi:glycosyltransferase involved in cell wall biosynthesis